MMPYDIEAELKYQREYAKKQRDNLPRAKGKEKLTQKQVDRRYDAYTRVMQQGKDYGKPSSKGGDSMMKGWSNLVEGVKILKKFGKKTAAGFGELKRLGEK